MTASQKKSLSISAKISGVPVGSRGKVYVEGRNDMADSQQMGITWRIEDPDGIVPANGEYTAWGLWPHTSPGDTHTFDGPTFNLVKVGTWRIAIGLYMNSEEPVLVDDYNGVLCVVKELAEFFKGTIVKKELKYDGITDDIPVQ